MTATDPGDARHPRPSSSVLRAFGVAEPLEPLRGGQGRSWRAGDLVLKPAPDRATLEWLDTVVRPSVRPTTLRFAFPRRAVDGEVVVGGWTATDWLEGESVQQSWQLRAQVAREVGEALADIDPASLPHRDDPWTNAERLVWRTPPEGPLADHPLCALSRPIHETAAVVHADVAGNVLVRDGLAAAVIDLTLVARPIEWSVAVLAVDVVCWEDAPVSLFTTLGHHPDFVQLLVRATLFRLTVEHLLTGRVGSGWDRAVGGVAALIR